MSTSPQRPCVSTVWLQLDVQTLLGRLRYGPRVETTSLVLTHILQVSCRGNGTLSDLCRSWTGP